ncbi:hypothetical protein [Caldifermentibacillus hisashii]|uniref:hypothetical protein n=1 Tax=Caldifermentibacillus hisashii TaxID=996558 RepID=UPI0031B69350
MPEFVGITRYNNFVDAEENAQTLEVTFSVHVKAKDYAAFQVKFLKELQDFLDKRK